MDEGSGLRDQDPNGPSIYLALGAHKELEGKSSSISEKMQGSGMSPDLEMNLQPYTFWGATEAQDVQKMK